MKTAVITGVTGQDGSYLSELLLSKGYKVIGIIRRSSSSNTERISHLLSHDNFHLEEGEVSDLGSVYNIVSKYQPDELYNLAAQSHVGTSFSQPDYTFQVDALGPLYFLQAIDKFSRHTKFYQASTSELFGSNYEIAIGDTPTGKIKYQDEETPFKPQSPYAAAKLSAHHMVRIYRDGYNIHASCGILFNHESPRRGEQFVTRKITKWIGEFYNWVTKYSIKYEDLLTTEKCDEIYCGGSAGIGLEFPKLRLGNLDAYRDWGHAKDYVKAMWLILQQKIPQDYVIATGQAYSVRDFLHEAFAEIGISDFSKFVVVDSQFYRPAEVDYLCGKPTKANNALGWRAETSFTDLVKEMVQADIQYVKEKKELQSKDLLLQEKKGERI